MTVIMHGEVNYYRVSTQRWISTDALQTEELVRALNINLRCRIWSVTKENKKNKNLPI